MKRYLIFGCALLQILSNPANALAQNQDSLAKIIESYGDDWERALHCYGLKKHQLVMIHVREGSDSPNFHKVNSDQTIYFLAAKSVAEQNSLDFLDIMDFLNDIHDLIMDQISDLRGDSRLAFLERQLVSKNCPVL